MRTLTDLFTKNLAWATEMTRLDPVFFERLAQQQEPDFFWIGCSDSRVPANQIVGLLPGEMFVHRNIANVVVEGDPNCLSAMQFAVDVLGVGDIIVCGHYGCGGVRAALGDDGVGLGYVDGWLRHIQEIRDRHAEELGALESHEERHHRLCELNVVEQVANVCRTSVVRQAWARGQELSVHGWIYDIRDGKLRDMDVTVMSEEECPGVIHRTLKSPPKPG